MLFAVGRETANKCHLLNALWMALITPNSHLEQPLNGVAERYSSGTL